MINMSGWLVKAAAAATVAMASVAHAQTPATTTVYNFGTVLSGPTSPSNTFATLSVTTSDSTSYTFSLQLASNLGTLFGNPGAFVRQVLFNTSGTDPIANSVQLLPGTWGVTSIKYHSQSAQPGSVSFDFSETLGQGANNRLISGERVDWGFSFARATTFVQPEFALHVQSIGSNGDSGWYIPTVTTPIPEPETYALMLAGLGVLGFSLRRRSARAA